MALIILTLYIYSHTIACYLCSAGLTSLPETAAGYISNSDRFHSDTAGEEYDLRMEKLRREKAAIQYRY